MGERRAALDADRDRREARSACRLTVALAAVIVLVMVGFVALLVGVT